MFSWFTGGDKKEDPPPPKLTETQKAAEKAFNAQREKAAPAVKTVDVKTHKYKSGYSAAVPKSMKRENDKEEPMHQVGKEPKPSTDQFALVRNAKNWHFMAENIRFNQITFDPDKNEFKSWKTDVVNYRQNYTNDATDFQPKDWKHTQRWLTTKRRGYPLQKNSLSMPPFFALPPNFVYRKGDYYEEYFHLDKKDADDDEDGGPVSKTDKLVDKLVGGV